MSTATKTVARALGVVLLALLGSIVATTEAGAQTTSAGLLAGEFRPIRNVGNGLCLQPQNSNAEAQVVQKDCDRNNPAQGWAALRNPNSNDYRFLNPNGWCINALGLGNGNLVLMLECAAPGQTTVSNAEWNASSTLPAVVTLRSRIHFVNNDFCLDVPNGTTTRGWPMQVWRCDGSAKQRWAVGFDWP